MHTGMNSRGAERGATLIELMIALILTGVVTVAIMRTYVTQHENYIVQDDVTNMQQSARSCIDELTRQVRMAGHDLPAGMPAIIAANTNPDTITIAYHGSDCGTFLTANMASASGDLSCDDVSCFNPGQWVYVSDPDLSVGEWFKISGVATGGNSLQHAYPPGNLSRQYPAGSLVMALNRVKFYLDNAAEPTNPRLMVQLGGEPAEPYADNISDLQFRYRLANGTIVDAPVPGSDIREILISIQAASNLNDPAADEQDGSGSDNGRRRTYTSSVSLRNADA